MINIHTTIYIYIHISEYKVKIQHCFKIIQKKSQTKKMEKTLSLIKSSHKLYKKIST